MDIGLLILRLVVGMTFVAHAVQKLFGWFSGPVLPEAPCSWSSSVSDQGVYRRRWPGS